MESLYETEEIWFNKRNSHFIDVLLVLTVILTSTFITKAISLPNASNADRLKPEKEIILVIQEKWWTVFEDNWKH